MKKSVTLPAIFFLTTVSAAQAHDTSTIHSLLDKSADAVTAKNWVAGAGAASDLVETEGLTPLQTAMAQNNLCIHMTQLQRFGGALDACDAAVAYAPEAWAVYVNRGNLLYAMGKRGAAKADYAKAKTLNPTEPAVD